MFIGFYVFDMPLELKRYGEESKLSFPYITMGQVCQLFNRRFKSGKLPDDIIEEIIASLEEDFERKEAYQPGLFINTLRSVANHIGSPSKYTHIDATKYRAKQILEAMKSWHIILEVSQYSLDPNHSDFLAEHH